jgi:hypothetical protein
MRPALQTLVVEANPTALRTKTPPGLAALSAEQGRSLLLLVTGT